MDKQLTAGRKLLFEAEPVQRQHHSEQRTTDHTQGLSRAEHRKRPVAKQAVAFPWTQTGSTVRPVCVRGH